MGADATGQTMALLFLAGFFAIVNGGIIEVWLTSTCSPSQAPLYCQSLTSGVCTHIDNAFWGELTCTGSSWQVVGNLTGCSGTVYKGTGTTCLGPITVNKTNFYYEVNCGTNTCPKTLLPEETTNYASPGFITLWAILGVVGIGVLIFAIVYVLTARKRRQSVPTQSSTSELPL